MGPTSSAFVPAVAGDASVETAPPSPPRTRPPLSPDLQQQQAWSRGRRRRALRGSIRSAAGEPP
jgi:hypothetical protein